MAWATPYMVEFRRVLRAGGACVLMAGVHAVSVWMQAAEHAGLIWMAELVVLWNQGKPRAANFGSLHTSILWFSAPGARHTWNSSKKSFYSNVLVARKVPIGERHHPAEKPIELTNFLVTLLSDQDDVILDPFTGSGSTLVSAALADRPYLGFERNVNYVKVAERRVANAEVERENTLNFWINGRLEEV